MFKVIAKYDLEPVPSYGIKKCVLIEFEGKKYIGSISDELYEDTYEEKSHKDILEDVKNRFSILLNKKIGIVQDGPGVNYVILRNDNYEMTK